MPRESTIPLVLVLTIIVSIICLLLYQIQGSEKKVDDISIKELSTRKRIRAKGSIDYDSMRFIDNRGDIFQRCPCKEGLICELGICKKQSGSFCLTNSECTHNNICFNGICTEKPNDREGIIGSMSETGKICVNKHPLKYTGGQFVMNKDLWWANGTMSIVDANVTGLVYILADHGLYRVSDVNKKEIHCSQGLRQLFRFRDKIYGVSTSNNIMVLLRENTSNPFKFKKVSTIYDKDFDEDVEEVYPCTDGSISIKKVDGLIYTFESDIGEWKEEASDVLRIDYGKTYKFKLIHYENRIEYWCDTLINGEMVFKLDGTFKDAIIVPKTSTFMTINLRSTIDHYIPVIGNEEAKVQRSFRKKNIGGSGDKFLKTEDDLWILTGSNCL